MYCKYCGSQIADDSMFCSICGKLVVDAKPQIGPQTSNTNELYWISTSNLQWIKPIEAKCTQIGILIILSLLMLYSLWCIISGGETQEYWSTHHEIYVKDPLELRILKFTSVKMFNWDHGDNIVRYGSFSKDDAKNILEGECLWFCYLF